MNTIVCSSCGAEIEIDKALEGQIEARVLAAAHDKHAAELTRVKNQAAAEARRSTEAAMELAQKEAQSELEITKKRLESEVLSAQKRAAAEHDILLKSLREDASSAEAEKTQLRAHVTQLTQAVRVAKSAKDNAELEMQKKLAEEESKIRAEATKLADERQRLNLAAKEKTITDLQKALDDAQRKAAQGSQQLQGEVMELDFEIALAQAFRDDDIEPVAKGVKGGDISQTVKSPRGTTCGVILWEIKRTKNWTDSWVPKLKQDLREARANVAVIITEALPKDISEDLGQHDGLWVCKPALAIVLGSLLRKGLLDVGLQKARAQNQGGKAEALFGYVTSHEFIQQIESMVETYQAMSRQVQKERVAYEKLWAQRDKQATTLLLGTANIIGSMQGQIGFSAMPRIRGLELDSGGDDDRADSPQSSLL
ncbi:MAG: DUF2130 domain-containing protein [Candidatus Saccharibacteria bacterium]